MANTVADERQRLNERLTALDVERGHIAFALSVLDRLDPQPQPSTRRTGRTRRGTKTGLPGGTLDRAVRLINASDRPWRVEELVPAMRQDGWTANVANEVETVRSALSRAVRDGLIERPEHGLYAPKDRDDPAAASAANEASAQSPTDRRSDDESDREALGTVPALNNAMSDEPSF